LNSKQSVDAAVPEDAHAEAEPQKKPNIVRRLYDWTIHWAYTPYAAWALLVLAFSGSSFFPVPPDVLLIAMALGAPHKAIRYAAICTAGSVLGAFLGYGIGAFAMDTIGAGVIEFYGLQEAYQSISTGFQDHGFFYVFVAALTPIPYKVFTIAAGACEVNLGVVVLASVVGRGLRFFAVGALFKFFGAPVKKFVERYFNLVTIAFLVLLVLGFVLVRILWVGGEQPPDGQPAGGGAAAEERKDGPADAEGPPEKEKDEAPPEEKEDAENEEDEKVEERMFTKEARKKLLEIARATVEAAVSGKPIPKDPIEDEDLQGHMGAFVTLKTDGKLRGCIGRFTADQALWKTIREMSVASATQDPRFWNNRIKPQEMQDVEIEISVLSPLEKIENPLDIELGKHGIWIRRGNRSGCFLPQVATETGWSKIEFLSYCCAHKAGLHPNAWKDAETDVLIFTAEIINETEELAEDEDEGHRDTEDTEDGKVEQKE